MATVDPFPASDFDQWADTYDRDVKEYAAFPFAGYDQVLETVVRDAAAGEGMAVLEIGIGTGNLASLFLQAGCRVWGTDYSAAMLEKARQKVPAATLVLHDLREPWPDTLRRRFDRVVSAYTFHHFPLQRKLELVSELAEGRLEAGGRIVIADLSFGSSEEMHSFARSVGDAWEEEPYWLAEEALRGMRAAGLQCSYEQVSGCAGVYRIEGA